MKLYKIIFILLVVISIPGYGQTIDLRSEDEVKAAYGASNYIYLGKYNYSNSSLTREEIISRFEIELKTSLAKKIISNAFDMLLNADQSVRFRVIGTATIGRGKVFITIPVQYSMEKKWNEIVR